ncbi:hypothetical protein LZ32DRAFT_426089 [Colletotrichum eremochloae]|nr:hypothetical protein LZ32DRAFT_426089 [Colletotrichum eremochloae]
MALTQRLQNVQSLPRSPDVPVRKRCRRQHQRTSNVSLNKSPANRQHGKKAKHADEPFAPRLDPPIWDNWLQAHDLGFLQTVQPAGPSLTSMFNQFVELGRIVHDMLSKTFAPRKMKDPLARRWNEVSLSKLNARLVAWHEALPGEMRWKRWSTNKDVLQPSVACLQYVNPPPTGSLLMEASSMTLWRP